jgi:anti-sigma regulatory factor (Ser/Thr protein kinase)
VHSVTHNATKPVALGGRNAARKQRAEREHASKPDLRRLLPGPPCERCAWTRSEGVAAVTSPSSRRAGVVQGSEPTATGPEPSSGAGPAFHRDEPEPPLCSYLELGALPSAVPCARLHARHVLWEWGLNELASDSELLVSELVTNAVQATAGRDQAAIRLRLWGDNARVLIEVWDADPQPPAPKDLGEHGIPDSEEEGGRGLFLVAMLSQRWGWVPTQEPAGKVVWCELNAGPPEPHGQNAASAPQALLPHRVRREQEKRPVEPMRDPDVLRRVRDCLRERP